MGYDLVARAKDGRLAWIGQFRVLQQEATDLWLPLVEAPQDIRGRLVNQASKPIAEVEITPNSLGQEEKPVRRSSARSSVALSSFVAGHHSAGRFFVLPQFLQVSFIHARMRADGLGTVKISWDSLRTDFTITLDRRLGRITGRFKFPDQRHASRDSPPLP